MQAFLGVFAAIEGSYSVETSLDPASQETKSAMDVISGILKTRRLKAAAYMSLI